MKCARARATLYTIINSTILKEFWNISDEHCVNAAGVFFRLLKMGEKESFFSEETEPINAAF